MNGAPPELPLISVVIPFKDAAPFIRETVDSVLSQNWTQLDVILVDDGGSDGSEIIARQFEAANPERVRVVTHEGRANRGTGPSRALGIAKTRGSLVAFLDADDVWEPNHLTDYAQLLFANPEADMVCGRVWAWRSWADSGSENVLSKLAFAPGAVVAGTRLLAAVLRNGDLATATCSLMVRREQLLGCLGHLESFPDLYEDQVVNSWVQLRAVAVMSGGTSAWYRQHDASISALLANRSGHSDRAYVAFLTWLRAQANDPEVRAVVETSLLDAQRRREAGAVRRSVRAVTPTVLRRGARVLRRMLLSAGASVEAQAERTERILLRNASDIRGDILVLGDRAAGLRTSPDVTTYQQLTWPGKAEASGPHHALASLLSAAYDCIVVLADGGGVESGDLRLRHLRRALRPAGVLLFVCARLDDALEQELRIVFGWDAVTRDHQSHPGPSERPLGLLRAAVPAARRAPESGPKCVVSGHR